MIKKGYFQKNMSVIQSQALQGIDNLILILEAPINLSDIKENKLQNACESKKEALLSIDYISNHTNLIGRRKDQVITALEYAFHTLMEVVAYEYIIEDEKKLDEETQEYIVIREGLPADIQKSVSKAKRIALEITISIGDTIDRLMEDEEVKQFKIDNQKPRSIIERYDNE